VGPTPKGWTEIDKRKPKLAIDSAKQTLVARRKSIARLKRGSGLDLGKTDVMKRAWH
jgi:hypothetical protein